uniref:N-acetylgalactosaminide beta-1,3-galactosyltransferase n=1 Tax=Talaromyces marneffei PM1 TaxID=1077442 RepID=A0A093VH81_TALMA
MQTQSSLHRLHHGRLRIWILAFAPILSLVLLWTWLRRPNSLLLDQYFSTDGKGADDGSINNVKPKPIPEMDEILVILKTGVTESLSKVPVHLETTLSSIPHFVVFSDYEEEIAGIRTHDVLRGIDEATKRKVPEFELYNRIREHGRDALTPADYGDDSNGPWGRQNNPGWRLDKWKFLPMIPAALDYKPDAKWFVFMEADSYIFWPNLVEWLSQLNHEQDWYLGFPMQIGNTIFAYGGSGFVVSNPAMRKTAQYVEEQPQTEIDNYTATQWAGDCVLGKMFRDAGVGLHWSWPMFQDSRLWEMDYFATIGGRRAWCYPVVSYHHMQPDDIRGLYEFESEWFKSTNHLFRATRAQNCYYSATCSTVSSYRTSSLCAMDGTTPPTTPSPTKRARRSYLLLKSAATYVPITRAVFHIGIVKMTRIVMSHRPSKGEQQPRA